MVQSSQSNLRSKLMSDDSVLELETEVKGTPATARVFQGKNPTLRNWKIAAPETEFAARSSHIASFDETDEEMSRIKSAHNDKFNINTPKWLEMVQYVSVFATVAWLTYSSVYLSSIPNIVADVFSSPVRTGGVLAAILAPVAMLWLCVTTWQRRSDAHLYAEALRRELQRLLFPTEEQSRAVNRDIQLLVQQAVEISTSSRAALKAIQKARQGLRAEIRDFSGVSQKTEFHIDRLTDTLNKRADELLKLTDQIEQRSKNIQEEVKSGVEVWSEISSEALEKVGEIQTSFDKSTQTFESQTMLLNAASHRLSSEAGKMEAGFETGFSKLEDLSDKGIQSFEKITTSLEKFDDISKGIFARSESVQENLAKQSEAMKEAAEDLNSRVNALDEVGNTAAHKLGEALSMALSGSDSIVSAVRRAREQLEKTAVDTTNKAEELLEQTDKHIENMSSTAADRLMKIQDMMQGFDTRHKDIAEVLEQLTQQNENVSVVTDTALDRLTTAVHLLDQSAEKIDIKSAKPVTEIREATEQLASQVDRIHQSLQSGIADIDVNTSKARSAAEEIAKSLREHTQDMTSLSGQVVGHAKTINNQLDDHKDKLCRFIEETEVRIDGFENRIENQLGIFVQTVEVVESNIDSLGKGLDEKGRKAIDDTSAYVNELKIIEVDVADQLSKLSAQTMQTSLIIKDYETGIRKSVEATEPLYKKMVEDAQTVDNRFDRLRDSAEASSNDILARMEALSQELESQISKLNSEVEDSERGLTSLTQDIKGSVVDIEQSADQATEKLKHLQTSIQGRTEDLQLLADQAELKIGNLQKTLEHNTSEMQTALTQATSKMEDATAQFEKSSHTIDERADTSSRKIEIMSNMFVEEGHRLALSGEQTLHKASRIVTSIQEEGLKLADKATATLSDIQRASDSLSIRAREIDEYSKAALNSTQSYNSSLKEQVRIISESSSDVVDTIGDALNNLQMQAEESVRQGDKMVEKVEKARQNLDKESDRLEIVAKKATEATDEAAARFTRHSSSIMKSAEDISSHAERIRTLQIRSSREAFLSSAKFIIESLHSLAVDVSRHLEDNVDDRSWRAYQKGDVSVFTRRLVQISDEVPMERVRRKFTEDGEFRNYTNRYIRQFEELYESAQSNDHGELLSSIFVSSDVGKLYRLLCDISGRAMKAV